MRLDDILYHEGFGTRRVCAGLVQQGRVEVYASNSALAPVVCADEATEFIASGLHLRVAGLDWVCHPLAVLMLHKPAGYECSQRPGPHPGVHALLPSPLRQRPRPGGQPGVQSVGRLDWDTTGLLLFTDDGALLHRLTSPKHHVAKVYEVRVEAALDDQVAAALLRGVVLNDAPRPVAALACQRLDAHRLQLTLDEGKYHQVKRMLAALGHHVVALHRSRIATLDLPPDLPVGQWRWLTPSDMAALGLASPEPTRQPQL